MSLANLVLKHLPWFIFMNPLFLKTAIKRTSNGVPLDFKDPKTIQDKLNWLKVYDCTPLKTKCADKIRLHEYCIEKLGKDICIPIIKTYKSTREIDWNELPNQFAIKCNHGSGMNILVKDKNKLDVPSTVSQLNQWLDTDHSIAVCFETHYRRIPRRILVEELMGDEAQTDSLFDYKFWCFHGVPKFYTINDGHGHGDIIYYDLNHQMFDPYQVNCNYCYSRPENFEGMVSFAEKLSADFKFVRVDFYEVAGEVYLGELTFTPGAGLFKYKDSAFARTIGDMLDLSK